MEGKIFDFNPQTGQGLIRGKDGARYEFTIGQFKSQGAPKGGMKVDFDVVNGEAQGIYAISGGGGAALVETLKGAGATLKNADISSKVKAAASKINLPGRKKNAAPAMPSPDFPIGDADETIVWKEPPPTKLVAPSLPTSIDKERVAGALAALVAILSLLTPFANLVGIYFDDALLVDSVFLIDGAVGKVLFAAAAVAGAVYALDLNRLLVRMGAFVFLMALLFQMGKAMLFIRADYVYLSGLGDAVSFTNVVLERTGPGFYLAAIASLTMLVVAWAPGLVTGGAKS